jgi:hypothetical protein
MAAGNKWMIDPKDAVLLLVDHQGAYSGAEWVWSRAGAGHPDRRRWT